MTYFSANRVSRSTSKAYFSIRGFELLRHTLPYVRHFRLLLGDKPLEGEDIGLRPDSAAYLRHELNTEPLRQPPCGWSRN
jgi:hypothetical protein